MALNGQANCLDGHISQDFSSCGVEVDNIADIESKTSSPPTKRAFEAGPGEDQDFTPAPKKARLSSPPLQQPQPQPQPYHLSQDEDLALDLDPNPHLHAEESIELDADDQEQPTPPRYPAGDPLDLGRPVDPYSRLDAFVSRWLETVGSSGNKHKRNRSWHSDGSFDHLDQENPSDSQPIAQPIHQPISNPRRSKSAPPVMDRKDNDGFAVPLTPSSYSGRSNGSGRGRGRGGQSAGSRSDARSVSPSGSTLPVEHPTYRDLLKKNRIFLRDNWSELPGHVEAIVTRIRANRSSPGPSEEEIRNDTNLVEILQGAYEEDVVEYYLKTIFPQPDIREPLRASGKLAMNRLSVPFAANVGSSNAAAGLDATAPQFRTPSPDKLYGYSIWAFPDAAQAKQVDDKLSFAAANYDVKKAFFPFLLVEFKGFGGTTYTATNQCLGGAATCVNVAEMLNYEMRKHAQTQTRTVGRSAPAPFTNFDSTVFSVAMSGSEALVYVSWRHDEFTYYTRIVESFTLHRPGHYIQLRRMVRNIVDWGMGERLQVLKQSLDFLIHGSAQPQPPPQGAQVARGDKVRERSPESAAGGSSSGSVSGKKQRM